MMPDSALQRAKERLRERRDSRRAADRFIIKGTGQVFFVKISDVDWIEAADYHVPRGRFAPSEADPAVGTAPSNLGQMKSLDY